MKDISTPPRIRLDDLTYVGGFDWNDEDWQFDLSAVWKETRGRYYVANDSGCSCPSPFEDINYVDDKGVHGPYNKTELRAYFDRLIKKDYGQLAEAELRKRVSDLLAKLT